jgi:hypothetical protein
MSVTTSRLLIYIALIALIFTLIYVKNKNMNSKTEYFTDTAFKVKVVSGSNISIVANGFDLLTNVLVENKKDNAMYLALIKVDGTPRIIDSYATGTDEKEDVRFLQDLKLYYDKAKLLSDKYIMLISKGTPYAKLSNNTKNFIKNNLKADKIIDIGSGSPYILIYDPVDDNVRVEMTGGNGESITYEKTLYSVKRDIIYNKDGLISSGLQCYLDATRKDSYNSSFGKVWKDLSGKGRNFVWEKNPLFADGKFLHTMFTSGSALGPNCSTFELGDGSKGYAIVICAKTNSLQYGHAFVAEGNPNYYGIQAHTPWPNQWAYFDQGWPYAGENVNRIDAYVGPCDEMCVWAFVRDYDSTMKIYKDGTLIVQSQRGSTADYLLNLKDVPWIISKNWDADISKFLIYNTFLSEDDVKDVTKWIQGDEIKQRQNRMNEQSKTSPVDFPVKLGLQLLLDTNNYTLGSTEWKDQSGNGFDFTWNSAPTVESKSFLLNGEYALSNKGSRLLNIDTRDSYTICWVAKTNSLSVNSVFKIKGNNDYGRGIFCHPTWVNNFIYFDQGGCCDDNTNRVYGSVEKYSSEYAFYTIKRNATERSIYVNGVKIASQPTGGRSININLEQMIIGRDLEMGYTWFANLRSFMVYNRDLTDPEITKLFNKLFSKYEFGRYTYEAADLFCRKQGKKLCKTEDYCVNGNPVYSLDDNDKWAPLGDYPDGWIQVGKNGDTCKSFKQVCQVKKDGTCDANNAPTWTNKGNREIAMMCCDTKYLPLIINAVLIEGDDSNIHKNKLTFFRDKSYQSIEPKDVSKMNNIKDFKGLTNKFVNGNIDAIVNTSPIESIWFRDKYVMVYNNSTKQGVESRIKDLFTKLPDDFYDGFLDAVASRGYGTEMIMFKKTRYCIVDMTTKTGINSGFISAKYPNMPKDFLLGFFDCAMWSGGSTSYLMKNDKLIQYDFSNNSMVKGPISIATIWNTLLPPFTSREGACKIYEILVNMYKEGDERKTYWNKKYYSECKRIAKTEYEVNLDNYKKLVKKYKEDYNKEVQDLKQIELQISQYEKELTKKKKEWQSYEQKYLDIKMKPCKKDDVCSDKSVKVPKCKLPPAIPAKDPKKKQIIIKEYDTKTANRKFYEMNSQNMENCYYDPDVGKEYPNGFNFAKHPKANDYIEADKVKTISNFSIKDYPTYDKYILKKDIPKQRTANDFKIEEHPDYYKYTKKKSSDNTLVAPVPK